VRSLDDQLRELVKSMVHDEVARVLVERDRATEYLSTAEAAERARVTTRTIRRWIDDKRLAACRAGREIRVRASDLDALLRGGDAEGADMERMAAEIVARRR
jgi:excisionase family DNA binding protein